MTDSVPALRARFAGAPDTLRHKLAGLAGDASQPRATRREASNALASIPTRPRGPGVVPFVVALPGGDDGAILYAIASHHDTPGAAPVDRDTRDGVRAGVLARVDALVHDVRLATSAPQGPTTWEGRSCELALAVAAVSCALGVAPRGDVVLTGALAPDGTPLSVTHVATKARVVARDLPDAALVGPELATLHAVLDATLPGWRDALAAAAAGRAGRRAREALTHLVAGRLDTAEALAARAAAQATDAAGRARAAWVLGAVDLHRGDADAGLARLEAARTAIPAWIDDEEDPPDDLVDEELEAYLLVALLDLGRVRAASARADTALARLSEARRRTRRWREVSLQLAGTAHRLAVACGDLDRARDLLERWSLRDARLAEEAARALGDLAEVERRAGRPDTARAHLARARQHLPDAGAAADRTASFLELYAARLDPASVVVPSGLPLWPTLGFRLLASRRGDEDVLDLRALPAVRARAPLRAVVAAELAAQLLVDDRPALRAALAEDARTLPTDDPATQDLLDRLAATPTVDDLAAWVRRAPYG